MTCAALMVHLELGRSNADLLAVTRDLAGRLEAGVIGIAACRPMQVGYGDVYVSGDLIEEDRLEIGREVRMAEAEFRDLLAPHVAILDWRAAVTDRSAVEYLANEARAADLFLTGSGTGNSMLGDTHAIDISDLVMRLGRPVLLVPACVRSLELNRAMLAWKDSREARRAALDALPLLDLAANVTVVEVADEDGLADASGRVADTIGWLGRHGIAAEPHVTAAFGNDVDQLSAAAQRLDADLIVAGAYGHGRLREWVLGGVTRDLLLDPVRCTMLSR